MNYDDDYEWLKSVFAQNLKRCIVETPIYIYNTDNENSLSHLIHSGKLDRIRK